MDQIDQIYVNQSIYKDHISNYLSKYKYTNISEIFIRYEVLEQKLQISHSIFLGI